MRPSPLFLDMTDTLQDMGQNGLRRKTAYVSWNLLEQALGRNSVIVES